MNIDLRNSVIQKINHKKDKINILNDSLLNYDYNIFKNNINKIQNIMYKQIKGRMIEKTNGMIRKTGGMMAADSTHTKTGDINTILLELINTNQFMTVVPKETQSKLLNLLNKSSSTHGDIVGTNSLIILHYNLYICMIRTLIFQHLKDSSDINNYNDIEEQYKINIFLPFNMKEPVVDRLDMLNYYNDNSNDKLLILIIKYIINHENESTHENVVKVIIDHLILIYHLYIEFYKIIIDDKHNNLIILYSLIYTEYKFLFTKIYELQINEEVSNIIRNIFLSIPHITSSKLQLPPNLLLYMQDICLKLNLEDTELEPKLLNILFENEIFIKLTNKLPTYDSLSDYKKEKFNYNLIQNTIKNYGYILLTLHYTTDDDNILINYSQTFKRDHMNHVRYLLKDVLSASDKKTFYSKGGNLLYKPPMLGGGIIANIDTVMSKVTNSTTLEAVKSNIRMIGEVAAAAAGVCMTSYYKYVEFQEQTKRNDPKSIPEPIISFQIIAETAAITAASGYVAAPDTDKNKYAINAAVLTAWSLFNNNDGKSRFNTILRAISQMTKTKHMTDISDTNINATIEYVNHMRASLNTATQSEYAICAVAAASATVFIICNEHLKNNSLLNETTLPIAAALGAEAAHNAATRDVSIINPDNAADATIAAYEAAYRTLQVKDTILSFNTSIMEIAAAHKVQGTNDTQIMNVTKAVTMAILMPKPDSSKELKKKAFDYANDASSYVMSTGDDLMVTTAAITAAMGAVKGDEMVASVNKGTSVAGVLAAVMAAPLGADLGAVVAAPLGAAPGASPGVDLGAAPGAHLGMYPSTPPGASPGADPPHKENTLYTLFKNIYLECERAENILKQENKKLKKSYDTKKVYEIYNDFMDNINNICISINRLPIYPIYIHNEDILEVFMFIEKKLEKINNMTIYYTEWANNCIDMNKSNTAFIQILRNFIQNLTILLEFFKSNTYKILNQLTDDHYMIISIIKNEESSFTILKPHDCVKQMKNNYDTSKEGYKKNKQYKDTLNTVKQEERSSLTRLFDTDRNKHIINTCIEYYLSTVKNINDHYTGQIHMINNKIEVLEKLKDIYDINIPKTNQVISGLSYIKHNIINENDKLTGTISRYLDIFYSKEITESREFLDLLKIIN